MHDLQKLVLQNWKFWRHQCMHAYSVCIVMNLGIRIQAKQTEVYDNKRRGVSRLQYLTSPILYITSKVPCRCTFTISPGTLSPLLRVRVTFAPFNVQRSSRAPWWHSSGCHSWLYLCCNINGCSDQSSTKVFDSQPVVLCSIPLNGSFMRNDTEEMLHGEHREKGAVGRGWKWLLHSPMCTQCRTKLINFLR